MKPSERRAMKQQERLQTEEQKSNAKKESISTRKEGFIQSHIRLLTFIGCMIILVWIVFPFSISGIIDMFSGSDELAKIDIEYVVGISEKGEEISWEYFEKYEYTDMSYEVDGAEYVKREYPISSSNLVLWVGGATDAGRPDFVYLVDYSTSDHIDIRTENVKEYLNQIQQQKEENK